MIYICQNAICTIDFLLQGLQEQLVWGVLAFQPACIGSYSKLGQGFFIHRSKRWSIVLLLKISLASQHLQVLLIQESSVVPEASWPVTLVKVK